MLELSHVTFRYAEGLPDVLKDISLSFDKENSSPSQGETAVARPR